MTTYHTRFVDIQLTQGVDAADITPYAGMWVPHNQLLELDSSWEFAPENEYDINEIPAGLNMTNPCLVLMPGWLAVYVTDHECASYFLLRQR